MYKKKPYREERECVRCKKIFIARNWNNIICINCKKTKEDTWQMKLKRNNKNVATGTVGAVGELIIATDLLKRGYEVFRALSPSCSCDLAILRNKKLLLVEVKTGHRNATIDGFGFQKSKAKNQPDIYAVVLNGPEEIIYIPKLE